MEMGRKRVQAFVGHDLVFDLHPSLALTPVRVTERVTLTSTDQLLFVRVVPTHHSRRHLTAANDHAEPGVRPDGSSWLSIGLCFGMVYEKMGHLMRSRCGTRRSESSDELRRPPRTRTSRKSRAQDARDAKEMGKGGRKKFRGGVVAASRSIFW